MDSVTKTRKTKQPFFYCTTRFLITWFLLTAAACFFFALVVFLALVDKQVLSTDDGPTTIPYINVPSKYDVMLDFRTQFDKGNETYSGTVRMSFMARDPSQRIFVHKGQHIKITEHDLYEDERKMSVKRGVFNKQSEIQTFIPSANLTLDASYIFEMTFVGRMNSEEGAPRQFSYESPMGEKRFGISFASGRAYSRGLRLLFPCLDGRDYPAIFDLTIVRHSSFRSISNYETTTVDARPPRMTDLIAAKARLYPNQLGLVLCDFPFKREQIDDMNVTVYYRPEALEGISIRRLRQFMDKTSATIGKIDAVVLADVDTVHQPGLSILNEMETVIESKELAVANQTSSG